MNFAQNGYFQNDQISKKTVESCLKKVFSTVFILIFCAKSKKLQKVTAAWLFVTFYSISFRVSAMFILPTLIFMGHADIKVITAIIATVTR